MRAILARYNLACIAIRIARSPGKALTRSPNSKGASLRREDQIRIRILQIRGSPVKHHVLEVIPGVERNPRHHMLRGKKAIKIKRALCKALSVPSLISFL
jgi:hypothetical protein